MGVKIKLLTYLKIYTFIRLPQAEKMGSWGWVGVGPFCVAERGSYCTMYMYATTSIKR